MADGEIPSDSSLINQSFFLHLSSQYPARLARLDWISNKLAQDARSRGSRGGEEVEWATKRYDFFPPDMCVCVCLCLFLSSEKKVSSGKEVFFLFFLFSR